MSDTPTRADYYPAGALKETDVDYVFNNVGFFLCVHPLCAAAAGGCTGTGGTNTGPAQPPLFFLGLGFFCPEGPSRNPGRLPFHLPSACWPGGARFPLPSYEELQAAGLAVDKKNYELVYTAPEQKTTLENIYRTFTDDRPADFQGTQPSVSDVVVVNRGGKGGSPLL